jgi:hypothetical protein
LKSEKYSIFIGVFIHCLSPEFRKFIPSPEKPKKNLQTQSTDLEAESGVLQNIAEKTMGSGGGGGKRKTGRGGEDRQEHFHVSVPQTAEMFGTGIGLQVGADCKATFWRRE